MKVKYLLFTCSVLLSSLFWSCSDDDDTIAVSSETRQAFTQKYPSVGKVEWEYESIYLVAEFRYNNIETSAWFDNQGNWYMTEYSIAYTSLPEAVKTAFAASQYGTWRVDDVDMIEQADTETFYVVEVEQGNQEADLYFTSDGILFRTVLDSPNYGYAPQVISTQVQAFINQQYPQARIIDIEAEGAMLEVTIIDGYKSKDVYFDSQDQWLYTSRELHSTEWPQAVTSLTTTGQYVGYTIDDVNFVETAQGNYYQVELEKGNAETQVKVPA